MHACVCVEGLCLYVHMCCTYMSVCVAGTCTCGYMVCTCTGTCVVCVSWVHACGVYMRGGCGVYVYTHVLCVSVSHPSPSSPPPASPTGCRISAGQMLGLSPGAASVPVPAPQAQKTGGAWCPGPGLGLSEEGRQDTGARRGRDPNLTGRLAPPPYRTVHQDKGLPHTTPTNVWWSRELRAAPQPAPPPGQEHGRGSQRRKWPRLLCTSQRSPSTAPGQREPRARFGCGGLFPWKCAHFSGPRGLRRFRGTAP